MSSIATLKPRAESAHYYTKDGTPMHTVTAKSTGKPRNTTVRDAKKMDLVPSVTTILRGGMPTPFGLQQWKLQGLLEHALTTERKTDESDDEYVRRIQADWEQAKSEAPDLGSEVHAILEAYYSRRSETREEWPDPTHTSLEAYQLAENAIESMRSSIYRVKATELTVVGQGYAGTIDLVYEDVIGNTWIVDFKTQRPKNGKVKTRDEWVYQLAAYDQAWMRHHPQVDGVANLIIPTDGSDPVWKPWSTDELERGWDVFEAATRLYYLINRW